MTSSSGSVAPDPAQIERFVNSLFAHASEGGFVSLRAFYDDELAKARNERPFRVQAVRLSNQRLEPVVRQAVKLAEDAARTGRPVVVAPPIATFSNGTASEKSLLEGLTLSIELDERPAESLATLRVMIGAPTLVVESGGRWVDPKTSEPHDKLHVHYRLAEPTQTPGEHEQLKRARSLACDLVGADATSKSPVHPMRWAGTVHRKDPAAPRLARIAEQNDTEIVLDDVLGELEGLQILRGGAPDSEAAPEQTRNPTGNADLLMACAKRIANPDLDWAAWNRLGMAFHRASEGSQAGFAAFNTFSRKSAKYDAAATRARWEHYRTSPPDRIGIGTLIYEARKADPSFRRRRDPPSPHGTGPTGAAAGVATVCPAGDALFDTSHDGLALAMGEQWQDARHVAPWGQWFFWAGTHWQHDDLLLHLTRTRDFLRAKADELVRWAQQRNDEKLVEICEAIAKQLRSAQMVANVVGLARSNPDQVATVEQWDANPFELGAPRPGRNTP